MRSSAYRGPGRGRRGPDLLAPRGAAPKITAQLSNLEGCRSRMIPVTLVSPAPAPTGTAALASTTRSSSTRAVRRAIDARCRSAPTHRARVTHRATPKVPAVGPNNLSGGPTHPVARPIPTVGRRNPVTPSPDVPTHRSSFRRRNARRPAARPETRTSQEPRRSPCAARGATTRALQAVGAIPAPRTPARPRLASASAVTATPAPVTAARRGVFRGVPVALPRRAQVLQALPRRTQVLQPQVRRAQVLQPQVRRAQVLQPRVRRAQVLQPQVRRPPPTSAAAPHPRPRTVTRPVPCRRKMPRAATPRAPCRRRMPPARAGDVESSEVLRRPGPRAPPRPGTLAPPA